MGKRDPDKQFLFKNGKTDVSKSVGLIVLPKPVVRVINREVHLEAHHHIIGRRLSTRLSCSAVRCVRDESRMNLTGERVCRRGAGQATCGSVLSVKEHQKVVHNLFNTTSNYQESNIGNNTVFRAKEQRRDKYFNGMAYMSRYICLLRLERRWRIHAIML